MSDDTIKGTGDEGTSELDEATARGEVSTIISDCAEYLRVRTIDQAAIARLPIHILSQSKLCNQLGCTAQEFPFEGGIYIQHGPGAGQGIAPKSLLQQRTSFIDEEPSNKRNTRGDQWVFRPPSISIHDPICQQPGVLYVCESAIKACALWRHGYTACAAAGVSSLYTTNRGWAKGWDEVANSIQAGEIGRIRVLFDADIGANRHVQVAARLIVEAALSYTGMRADVVPIDCDQWRDLTGDPKAGIDDVLYKLGDEAGAKFLADLLDLDKVPEMTDAARAWAAIQGEYALCYSPPGFIRLSDGELYNKGDMALMTAVLDYDERIGKSTKRVRALDEWLANDARNQVGTIDYIPGAERVVLGRHGHYNRWIDDGVPAMPGDVTPFVDLYINALGGSDECFNQWCDTFAYMLQHRGVRIPRLFYAVGAGQGTGKSTLAYVMRRILGGNNFCSIDAEDLTESTNEALVTSELVLIDDVDRLSRKHQAVIKRLSTDDEVLVKQKYVKPYTVKNHVVLFMTSNELANLRVEHGDRRAVVLPFQPLVTTTPEEWRRFFSWLDEHGGASYLRYWLENRDLSEFNPWSPVTSVAKDVIAGTTTDEVEAACLAIKEDSAGYWGSDTDIVLFTSADLMRRIYGDEERIDRKALTAMGHRIGQHFHRANQGQPVRIGGGKMVRLFTTSSNYTTKGCAAQIRAELERTGQMKMLLE